MDYLQRYACNYIHGVGGGFDYLIIFEILLIKYLK